MALACCGSTIHILIVIMLGNVFALNLTQAFNVVSDHHLIIMLIVNHQHHHNGQHDHHNQDIRRLITYALHPCLPSAEPTVHIWMNASIHPPIPHFIQPENRPSIPCIHPFVHPSIKTCIYLSTHPSISPPIHPSLHVFIYPSIHSSVDASDHPWSHPAIYPSVPPSTHRSIQSFINPFHPQPIHASHLPAHP